MSQLIQTRVAEVSGRISAAWQAEAAWTPRFNQVLAAAAREACRDLHAIDAEEVSHRLGLVLLDLGAITRAQLPCIGAFLG